MERMLMSNGIVLTRIDQRLIHGIVVNQWTSDAKPTRLMVIDDVVANDDMLKASMRMSKPVGTSMSIINTQTAINNFLNGNYKTQRVFVVVKEPSVLLKLAEAGVALPNVDVGIIFLTEGKRKLTEWVAVDEREETDLRALSARGIPTYIQYVPGDAKVDIAEYLS